MGSATCVHDIYAAFDRTLEIPCDFYTILPPLIASAIDRTKFKRMRLQFILIALSTLLRGGVAAHDRQPGIGISLSSGYA